MKSVGMDWMSYQSDRYSITEELARLKSRLKLNCSDLSQLTYIVGKDLGLYTTLRFVHLICASNDGHVILEILGNEFTTLTWVDVSAMLHSGYSMGTRWCYNGVNQPTGHVDSYDDPWLTTAGGEFS